MHNPKLASQRVSVVVLPGGPLATVIPVHSPTLLGLHSATCCRMLIIGPSVVRVIGVVTRIHPSAMGILSSRKNICTNLPQQHGQASSVRPAEATEYTVTCNSLFWRHTSEWVPHNAQIQRRLAASRAELPRSIYDTRISILAVRESLLHHQATSSRDHRTSDLNLVCQQLQSRTLKSHCRNQPQDWN